MDITVVSVNYSGKFNDDTMTKTLKRVSQTAGQADGRTEVFSTWRVRLKLYKISVAQDFYFDSGFRESVQNDAQ